MIELKYIWSLVRDNFLVRKHAHNFYEIIYYFQGKGTVNYLKNESYKINTETNIEYIDAVIPDYKIDTINFDDNTLIFIPANILHDETHTKHAEIIDIGFIMENEEFNLAPIAIKDSSHELYDIASKVRKEYDLKQENYREIIDCLIRELLLKIERNLKAQNDNSNPIENAKNFITNNYATSIDLEKLAKESGYGPERFRFLFKNLYGISPKEFIIKKRLDNACHLLKDTTYSISQISDLCGYDDIAQFSTIFKKKIGVTPKDFRQK